MKKTAIKSNVFAKARMAQPRFVDASIEVFLLRVRGRRRALIKDQCRDARITEVSNCCDPWVKRKLWKLLLLYDGSSDLYWIIYEQSKDTIVIYFGP